MVEVPSCGAMSSLLRDKFWQTTSYQISSEISFYRTMASLHCDILWKITHSQNDAERSSK
jgi:hypothetical protein